MRHIVMTMVASLLAMGTSAFAQQSPMPGKGGDKYVAYDERNGNESIVYFTRSLGPDGLVKAYEQVCGHIKGNVGVKLHTGEQNGPNIIPREWVRALLQKDLPEAKIVETNTYYEGDRYTTEQHRKTLEVNGWTFIKRSAAIIPVSSTPAWLERHFLAFASQYAHLGLQR